MCTPGDLIAKDIEHVACQRGNLVVIEQAGAYGPTASPTHFLSHGFPAEIAVYGEDVYPLRRSECFADLMQNQFHLEIEPQGGLP